MNNTERLERETELKRRQLADTLEELRASLTPGQVVDQVLDYANRSGSAAFTQRLQQQVVANPLPVALIGASIAWLMVADASKSSNKSDNAKSGLLWSALHRSSSSGNGGITSQAAEWSESASDTADSAAHGVQSAARSTTESLSGTAETVEHGTQSAAERLSAASDHATDAARQARDVLASGGAKAGATLKGTASSTYGAASSFGGTVATSTQKMAAAASHTVSSIGQSGATGFRAFADLCREQPILLGALGVALGTALGALIPGTAAEDRLIGERSDAAKERMQRLASQQFEKAKAAAGEVGGAARVAADETTKTEAFQNAKAAVQETAGVAADEAREVADQASQSSRAAEKQGETEQEGKDSLLSPGPGVRDVQEQAALEEHAHDRD